MITVNRLKMDLCKYRNMSADIENMDPARLLGMILNDLEVAIRKEEGNQELAVNSLRFLALYNGMRTKDLIEQGAAEVDLNRRNGNRLYS